MPIEHIRILLESSPIELRKRGQFLYQQRASFTGLPLLMEGTVKICHINKKGATLTRGFEIAPTFLGLREYFFGSNYLTAAMAIREIRSLALLDDIIPHKANEESAA